MSWPRVRALPVRLAFTGGPSLISAILRRMPSLAGAPVQIELAHLADPAIGALLTGRGYRLTSFENVLGRALQGERERVTPPGIEVRPSGEEEFGELQAADRVPGSSTATSCPRSADRYSASIVACTVSA